MELLAPAGTRETFWAALESGADAVYAGIRDFNARAVARNFTLRELEELNSAAHGLGRRLFVAMNSLVKEREIPRVVEILGVIEAMAVDAVIIQDLGLWRIARRNFPRLRLHASTLMTIHNSLGVRQAHAMGFARVVLAREMTLEEVAAAAKAAPVETEVFVHGALCFSYSGLCLFSSYFGGRASTRGRCVQPCRRRYSWKGRTGTSFSMGDLCALEGIEDLQAAGVRCLKIEGRLRPPHYVASVVAAYRMLLDAAPGEREAALIEAAALVRNALGRPFTRGYLVSARPGDAIDPERSANTGQYLGEVAGFQGGALLVRGKTAPSAGDRLRLLTPDADRQEACRCTSAAGGPEPGTYRLVCATDHPVPKGTLVFRADLARSPLLPGEGGAERASSGHPPPRNPRSGARWKRALARGREKAREVLAEIAGDLPDAGAGHKGPHGRKGRAGLWVRLRDLRQLGLVEGLNLRGILIATTPANVKSFLRKRPRWTAGLEVVWSLPPVIHEERLGEYLSTIRRLEREGFNRFEVANIGQLAFLAEKRSGARKTAGTGPLLAGSYTLNCLNSQAIFALRAIGIGLPQFSVESDRDNARLAIRQTPGVPVSFTVFGYLPLFTSRMDHPSYSRASAVTSPKGERFRWQVAGETGCLVPEQPFSLLDREEALLETGFSDWIIDLSHWPQCHRPARGRQKGLVALLRRLGGRKFNFPGSLE